MDRDKPRRQAGFNSRQLRAPDPIGSRPDRIALWAVVLAVVVLVAAAGTARAGSGAIAAGAKGASTGGATVAEDPGGRSQASFFGPGLYGNEMACGETLARSVVGVAHRSLPCGTKIRFRYGGRSLRTTVVDRGPSVKGITWDLTSAAAAKLGLTSTDTVRAAVGR